MDYGKPMALVNESGVRKRESKLRPPKNYHPRSKGSSVAFSKKPASSLAATFGYKPVQIVGEAELGLSSVKDPYDTPDIVSSCDSKVSTYFHHPTL